MTWPVFFSIQRQMKEDHDVISVDDQMSLRGSYQRQAPFISAHIDSQIRLPVRHIGYTNLLSATQGRVTHTLCSSHSSTSDSVNMLCPVSPRSVAVEPLG